MQINQITNHMVRHGFARAVVNGQHIEVLLREQNGEAYSVAVVDCDAFPELTVQEYENMIRGIRSSLYRYQFSEVHLLCILGTTNPESVKELIAGFGEHWVVDLSNRRLLIYENQITEYLNVKELVETALISEDSQVVEQVEKEKMKKRFWQDNLCSIGLFFANLLVFVILTLLGNTEDPSFMEQYGAMSPSLVGHGFWEYRMFSSMFLHFGIAHLANNMFMLLVMGSYIEKYMEKWKYLTIYLGAGLIGNIVSLYYYIYSQQLQVVFAGASGAIFGLTGALLWIAICNRGQVDGLGLGNIIFLIILNVYLGVIDPSVGNAAHIGGLIGGFVLAVIFYHRTDKEETAS